MPRMDSTQDIERLGELVVNKPTVGGDQMSTPKEVRERQREKLRMYFRTFHDEEQLVGVYPAVLVSLLDDADDRDTWKERAEKAERGRVAAEDWLARTCAAIRETCGELDAWKARAEKAEIDAHEWKQRERDGLVEALRDVGRVLGRDTKGVYRVIAEEMASIARAALAKYGATS